MTNPTTADRRVLLAENYRTQAPDFGLTERDRIQFHLKRLEELALTLNAFCFVNRKETVDLAWLQRSDLFYGIDICSEYVEPFMGPSNSGQDQRMRGAWFAFRELLVLLRHEVPKGTFSTPATTALLYFAALIFSAWINGKSAATLGLSPSEALLQMNLHRIAASLQQPIFLPDVSIESQLDGLRCDLMVEVQALKR